MSTLGWPSRSSTTTRVPSSAKRFTTAAPMPAAPPVTMAVLPFSPRITTSYRALDAEALAAAAALAHVRVVVAQPPRQALLHEVDARALHVGQAERIDHDAQAAAFEAAVLRVDRVHGIDAVAKPRAAGRLDRQAHRQCAGMPRELQAHESRRALA